MNEKLLMEVGLVDAVTKPLRGITKEMQSSMDIGRRGVQNVATGAAGLVATGFAIQNALMPAIEMDRKMGEVKSLGVTDEALKTLQGTALEFSAAYGKSATEFVSASYDIQSAIAGLDGHELSQFTKASGVLAAATKADTGTITNYMGTMYGIFEKSALEMGKGEWVNQISGMTASAVQMFKTDGSKMAQAFSTLGSSATAMGADVTEQMAILGTLQATMGGSEAATKYTAFLGGAVKAQDKLGLSFTDSQGRLLPMVDILSKLDGEIGHMGEASQYAVLKDAFGSEEAVKLIQNLLPKTKQLSRSIEQLGQVQGLSKAEEMAAAMTDQWERLESVWFAVRAAVFGAVLPAINAVVGSMADGMMHIVGWVDEFPLLGEILGWVAIAGLSLGGVVASLSLIMGVGQMMTGGWAITMTALKTVMLITQGVALALGKAFWNMGVMLLTNPIGLVLVGLAAGIAAIIYWWDDLKASFGDTAIFKALGNVIDWVIDKLNMIPGIDIDFKAGAMPEMEAVKVAEKAEIVAPMKATAVALAADNPLMPSPESTGLISYKNEQSIAKPSAAAISQFTNNNNQHSGSMKSFGDVYITTEQGLTPDQLAEWDELNAG